MNLWVPGTHNSFWFLFWFLPPPHLPPPLKKAYRSIAEVRIDYGAGEPLKVRETEPADMGVSAATMSQ